MLLPSAKQARHAEATHGEQVDELDAGITSCSPNGISDQMAHRQHRRPSVKRKSITLEHARATAGHLFSLDNSDVVSAAAQEARRRQTG
jgi:hypothetical protein